VNDAPALSAAQVGIAVEGATDAAKNAADLILTEPGLSPIYGAVLESRRIFARIKAYVVYRVAASMIMAMTLSIIIFVTSCAVDSLLVIILALLNDLSMIPVAYDRASATTKPQLPNAKKIVLQSVFYGLMLTGLSLIFIFGYDYGKSVDNPISLSTCDKPTTGFVWFHLVMVTEVAIFSVRSPSFFFLSVPAPALAFSVFITIVVAAIIAVLVNDLTLVNMGIIIGVNAAFMLVVDALKMWFRRLINDEPGDTIESDELIPVDDKKTETQRHMEKNLRYRVHQNSTLSEMEMQHRVEIVDRKGWKRFFADLRFTNISGFVNQRGTVAGLAREQWAISQSAQFDAPSFR
jgi:H+-transporting ATPase